MCIITWSKPLKGLTRSKLTWIDCTKLITCDKSSILNIANTVFMWGPRIFMTNTYLLCWRMDKDRNSMINWEEWRDFLLLQPNANWVDISRVWRHATVSIFLFSSCLYLHSLRSWLFDNWVYIHGKFCLLMLCILSWNNTSR